MIKLTEEIRDRLKKKFSICIDDSNFHWSTKDDNEHINEEMLEYLMEQMEEVHVAGSLIVSSIDFYLCHNVVPEQWNRMKKLLLELYKGHVHIYALFFTDEELLSLPIEYQYGSAIGSGRPLSYYIKGH